MKFMCFIDLKFEIMTYTIRYYRSLGHIVPRFQPFISARMHEQIKKNVRELSRTRRLQIECK